MNRRGFLLTAPALLILPELIRPERTYFLPPVGGWPSRGAIDVTTSGEIAVLYDLTGYRTTVNFAYQGGVNLATMSYQSMSNKPIRVNGFLLAPFEKIDFVIRNNRWERI